MYVLYVCIVSMYVCMYVCTYICTNTEPPHALTSSFSEQGQDEQWSSLRGRAFPLPAEGTVPAGTGP